MRDRCPSTVRSERNSAAATSRLVLPSATRRCNALFGRSERARRRRPPADSLELGACPRRPERCTDPLEDRQRVLEGRACLPPPLGSPLRSTQGEKRAGPVERKVDLRMPRDCFLVRRDGGVGVARLCSEQPSAARAVGERRHALEPLCVSLVPVEELDRLVSTTEVDQGLDVVDHETERARLSEELAPCELDDRAELVVRSTRIFEREGQVTEPRARHELRGAAGSRRNELQRPIRRRSRRVRLSELCRDEPFDREVVRERHQLARLPRELLALECKATSGPELSDEGLDHRGEQEHVRSGALVAEVQTPLQSVTIRLPGTFHRVRPPPVDRPHPERLSENASIARGVLDGKRASECVRRAGPPEKRLGKELRAQCFRSQSFVAQVDSELRRQLGMVDGVLELLAPAEQARRNSFVRCRERLAIIARFVDRLQEQGRRLVLRLVRPHACEAHERPRP